MDEVAECVARGELRRRDVFAVDARDVFETAEHRVDRVVDGRADVHAVAVAGYTMVGREMQHLLVPTAFVLIEEDEVVATGERFLPRRQRCARIATELLVRALHEVEGVVVEPEEHVKAVLLDALMVRGVSTARAFASQSPSWRVHGDLVSSA